MLPTDLDLIVTFGDSLSDSGMIAGLADRLVVVPFPIPEPMVEPGYAGVFSDGPVHTQIFPGLLGADHAGYAAGSAKALGEQRLGDLIDGVARLLIRPGLDSDDREALLDTDLAFPAQIARFAAGAAPWPGAPVPAIAPEDAVAATLFIGLNDIAAFAEAAAADPAIRRADARALADGLAGSVGQAVADLAGTGLVDAVALYAPFSLDFFPVTRDAPERALRLADVVAERYAAALEDIAAAAPEIFGIDAQVVDLAPLSQALGEDPAGFGFAARGPYYFGQGTDPEITGFDLFGSGLPTVSFPENPEVDGLPLRQIQFFDEVHPTTATHGILAAYEAAVLTGRLRALGDGDDARSLGGADHVALAAAGDDRLDMGRGADTAIGGLGADTLTGAAGGDLLAGGSGDDVLRGGRGADLLAAGPGDDRAAGGKGSDLLIGSGGDVLAGGSGRDDFVWIVDGDGEGGTIRGGRGGDRVTLVVAAAAEAEAIRAELDAAEPGAQSLTLESAGGLELLSVGRVEVVASAVAALDGETLRQPDLLDAALLWGLV